MKKYILLIVFTVCCSCCAVKGQSKPPQADELKTVKIEKYGVRSISIPLNLTKESGSETARQNDDLTWTDYYKNYRVADETRDSSSMEVDVMQKIWNADLVKVTARQPGLDTPEKVMEFELAANAKNLTPDGIGINSVNYHQVDGVKGILTKGTMRENRIRVVWSVCRLFENKPQNITVAVSCPRNDLEKAMKIIDSLDLSAETRTK